MGDFLKDAGPQDRTRIDMTEDWEVQWWCRKWDVTAEQIKNAVAEVGPMTHNVARRLGKEL